MEWITHIGFVAAFCTSVSFAPQAYKIIKTKDTKGISIYMYSLFVTGVSLWLIYGILINDLPMTVANVVTLTLSSFILIIKIRNRKRELN